MKKNYQSPEMLTVLLANEDVISTSLADGGANGIAEAWDFDTKFGA